MLLCVDVSSNIWLEYIFTFYSMQWTSIYLCSRNQIGPTLESIQIVCRDIRFFFLSLPLFCIDIQYTNARMSSFKSSSACFRKGFTHQNESKRDVVIDIVYVTCYSARIIWILLVVNWLLLSLLAIAHNLCHIFNASPSPSCIIYSSVLPFGSFYAPACRLCVSA